MGELKAKNGSDYKELCKPPASNNDPQTAFEMMYYCQCYGQRECEIKIKSQNCVAQECEY